MTSVARRVEALERATGMRLFDRLHGGLSATAEGAVLLARAEQVEAAIGAERRRSPETELVGTVRITAGEAVIHHALLPRLAELSAAHPGIVVEFRADTRALDLSRREGDVAVRMARPTEASLVAQRFGAMRFGLYASSAYLYRRGIPRSVSDLANHDIVGPEPSASTQPQIRWLGSVVKGAARTVRAETATAQLVACAEGAGIALLGSFVAAHEPRLVPLLPSLRPPPHEAWIVTHQDARKSARVGAVVAWLSRGPSPQVSAFAPSLGPLTKVSPRPGLG